MAKDDAVYDAITNLMSEGRTSRLYRALVRDKKIASFSAGFSGLPGTKYPHLFAFYAFPLPGHTTKEMGDAIHVEIERLKKEDVSDEELKMVKTRSKADLIRGLPKTRDLRSIRDLPARYGDWREFFRSVERIDKVTKADIRRIANETFNDKNRTVGMIETAGARSRPRQGWNELRQICIIQSGRPATWFDRGLLLDDSRGLLVTSSCSSRHRTGTSVQLAADPDSTSAPFPPSATETYRTFQRHGHLLAGRSRTASGRSCGTHSRRFHP